MAAGRHNCGLCRFAEKWNALAPQRESFAVDVPEHTNRHQRVAPQGTPARWGVQYLQCACEPCMDEQANLVMVVNASTHHRLAFFTSRVKQNA